jgi:tetratricopeptide (TPR) repeat protein
MKKVFIILFLTATVIFQLNCGSTNSENSNSANTNSTPVVATNTNVQPQETPLPTFNDAETALVEGKRLLDENKTEQSIEALNQAVKLNPELADAYFTLGIAYSVLEKERENTQTVEEEPTPTPKKTPVPKKGKKEEFIPVTDSDKAFDKAAKIYEKITKKEPKNDVAFFNLGRSYNKLNKDEEAREALSEAVKLKPDDIEYQAELGAILNKLSEYDEAVKVLKKAASLDENNSYVQDLLAKAEAGQKRINFGLKPKTPEPPKQAGKPQATKPNQRPTPPLKIEEVPIPRPTTQP